MTTFWIIAAILTALVTFVTIWPLLRRADEGVHDDSGHDVQVYRAQMIELDGDVRRGLIEPREAASARAEIGRRMLRAASRPGSGGGKKPALLTAGLAVLLAVPLATFLLYARLGAPDAPDLPLATRSLEGEGDLGRMIAAAEARLVQNPQDGQGWEVLAPIYLRLGQSERAAHAFAQAAALLGETPARLAGRGEALMQGANGRVTPEARTVFARAAELDPSATGARFFLALGLSQERLYQEAVPAWESLLADSPADAPWRPVAEQALAEARQAPVAPRGPTAEDVAAVEAMSGEDRELLIQSMVGGLAERLEQSPDDIEGWRRLIRAYTVLGQDGDARDALEQAREVFADAPDESGSLAALAAELGLEEEGEPRT